MSVKAPYALVACDQLNLSKQELEIVFSIDMLMQRIRRAELSNVSGLQELVSKHVEAAEKYYGDFTAADMFELDMFNTVAMAVVNELKGGIA